MEGALKAHVNKNKFSLANRDGNPNNTLKEKDQAESEQPKSHSAFSFPGIATDRLLAEAEATEEANPKSPFCSSKHKIETTKFMFVLLAHKQIQEFNDVNNNFRIFLLSTRDGGLGINLTAADTCILYDNDWNPQMDLQAMDRCHRIGQTKLVHVYKLATAQSVEGRMLKIAFSKLKLEHVVIEKGQFHQERTTTSIMDELEMEPLTSGASNCIIPVLKAFRGSLIFVYTFFLSFLLFVRRNRVKRMN